MIAEPLLSLDPEDWARVTPGGHISHDSCPEAAELARRAADVFPDHLPHHEYNRREWLRAVRLVRSTARGWNADLTHRA